jgi:hypothetical protein
MRWLALKENRRVVGRGIAILLASLLFAGVIINSEQADRKRGQNLTRDQYAKEYESYRKKLIDNADAPLITVIIFAVFAVISFTALECAGIVIGVSVGAADEAMERRRARQRAGVIDDTDEY